MTFRAKPVVKRAHRPSWETNDRRNMYLNIGFGVVVVIALLILVAAAAASYYDEHFSPVAWVNGSTISKDDLRDRAAVDTFRIDNIEARIRDQLAAGRITQAQADQQLASLKQSRGQIPGSSLEKLIDVKLQAELAADKSIAISEEQIDARVTEEATRPEQRHIWEIGVAPEVSEGATEPTTEQDAAARAKADQALADLKAGKTFEDVAKAVSTESTAAQGGDLGWTIVDGPYDRAFIDAVFAAPVNTPTEVVKGEDGVYRIGRASEIFAASVDPDYEAKITDAGVPTPAYRAAVAADLTRTALEERVTADATETATVQRDVAEIFIDGAASATPGDQVKSAHILFSPHDDPSKASELAADDPAWAKAEEEANAAYAELQKDPTKFEELAKTQSDDTGSGASGGDLPWFGQSDVDPAFGSAIFAEGLTPGQILPPVKSSFGWHIIRFEDRRPDALTRARLAQVDASKPGADFGAIAKDESDGPEASSGGGIGWVARSQLEPQLEDAIFATPVGSVSELVTTSSGYYIFKVLTEETRKADGAQLDTLEADAFTNWYAGQKAAALIERKDSTTTATQ